jgi:hypothetical protein
MNGKIIAALSFILIAGGGAYFYVNNSSETPEEEVVKAWQNMAKVDSLKMDMDILFSFTEPETEEDLGFSFNLSSDIDKVNEKAKMTFSGDFLVQGMSMSGSGDLVFAEDNLYGKVNTLPTALLYEFGIGDVATEFMGKNILLIEKVSEKIEETTTTELSEERTIEIMGEVSTKAFQEKVVVLTEKGEEKVNGKNATKYGVKVDYKKLPDFLLGLTEDYKDLFSDEEERLLVVEGIEDLKEEFNNLTEEELAELEQLEMNLYSDGKHIVRFETLLDLEEDATTMEVVLTFGNFNEEFEINAPEEYVELEEIVNQYMMDSFTSDDYGEDSEVITPEDVDVNVDYDEEITEEDLEEMFQEFEQVE